jgi:hypothetical protein
MNFFLSLFNLNKEKEKNSYLKNKTLILISYNSILWE